LVLFVSIQVKEIARLGRLFPWQKPDCCPQCHGTLWWHGFVLAYFSCLSEAVYLRRLRCSSCGAVHRMRPSGYFRRFRATIAEIKSSIAMRSSRARWRPDLPRSTQRQWWLNLWRMIRLILGMSYRGDGIAGFVAILQQNIIPVTRAGQKENRSVK
jgi:hypothetical protein